MTYRLSRRADRDIASIWNRIAADSLYNADRVELTLHEAMERLTRFPNAGHQRADVKDRTIRFWPVYAFLIAYRVGRRSLVVVRVLDGRRDVRRLFRNK